MSEKEINKRHRNVAHLWADKRVIRFFRKTFAKTHYKNLRSVYLALCEIDSDFGEGAEIRSFAKTVATYAGMNEGTVRPYLRALQKADIIDYEQQNVDGQFGGTLLLLYEWREDDEERKAEIIQKILSNRMRRTRDPVHGKSRSRETPFAGKPVNGISTPFKNNKLSRYKNPSKEGSNIYLSPDDLSPNDDDDRNEKNKKSKVTPMSSETVAKTFAETFAETFVETKKEDKNTKFLPLASKLADIIRSNKNVKINQAKISSWANEIRKLSETDGVSLARIKDALEWYADNIGGVYVPIIDGGATLRNKFIRLEEAIKRAGGSPSSKNGTTSSILPLPEPSPQKLIKQHFKNNVLRKAFLDSCYKPAKNLFRNNERVAPDRLIEQLLNLHSQIERAQVKNLSKELRTLLPGSIELLSRFISWIETESWITDPDVNVFDVRHGLFSKFRRAEALRDNHERDALTGQSYVRE